MTKLARFFGAAVLLASGTVAGQTTATVFVPGNTLGDFGNPSVDGNQPYVAGIVATGPGKIVITYLSGEVTDCCPDFSTGPDGTPFYFGTGQSALQEALGISGGTVTHTDALIGIFVPRYRVQAPGFKAVDGAKNVARVGLLPSDLFFIGTDKTITVLEAGTLFLGINDDNAASNGGGYNVLVTFTPVP
jgi:hypothetical protein